MLAQPPPPLTGTHLIMIRLSTIRFSLALVIAMTVTPRLASAAGSDPRHPSVSEHAAVGIGLADFEHQGYGADGIAAAARGLVEQELARRTGFTLIERSRLSSLLEEISFQQSGITRPEGAVEVGISSNVQLILFGQVARSASGKYRLALRIVDVATGRVLRAEETPVPTLGAELERAVRVCTRRLLILALAGLPVDDVSVPAGSFTMGADGYPEEGPVHTVQLDAFRIDRTEVSQAAVYTWLEAQGLDAALPGKPDLPATNINWHDAVGYCGWVGKRLPTEAEWERAARGPSGFAYPWGQDSPSPRTAHFAADGPVGVLGVPAGASGEGALQLSGNVAEWVADWYDPQYYARSPESNPRGPEQGDFRVVRGGGFSSPADDLRAAARGFHNAVRGAPHIGFRCAVSTPSSP